MNRIKIIKRANPQPPPERRETESKKVSPATIKSRAAKVVGNWIDEWRAAKPEDAERAFADLFGARSSATN